MKRTKTTYLLLFLMLTIASQSVMAQRDVRTNIRQGNRAFNQQRYLDATISYEQALNENATQPEALFNLGNAFYRQGDWERAVEQYRNFLSVVNDDPLAMSAAWHNMGNALMRDYRINDAMEAYKNALRLNPMDDETRYNLATLLRMGRPEDEEDQDDGEDNEDDQPQEQEQDAQHQPQQNVQVDETEGPEHMSREAAREILQAIEQNERETLERIQRRRDAEREQQMDLNRQLNRNW